MKKAAITLFSALSALVIITYVVSCFTPYISPATFWPMTFLALGFPLLAFGVLLLLIVWMFINRKIALTVFILFLAGYKNITSVFAFRPSQKFSQSRDSSTLRIVTWNVKVFKNNLKKVESPSSRRRQMMDFLQETNADILLMQEFLEVDNPSEYSNVKTLRDTLGFKYYYTSMDKVWDSKKNKYKYGCAIFSKLPIINPQQFQYTGLTATPESLSQVDLMYKGKMMRLATTHLVSLNLGEPANSPEFLQEFDSDFLLHSSQFEKIRHYDSIHGWQAVFVKKILDKSPYPLIMSGDFNSVPGSFAYHTIKGKLQDAFIEKGSGIGRTYTGISPTLRIDYLFTGKQFEVVQYSCPQLYLSDHFPVVVDVRWR